MISVILIEPEHSLNVGAVARAMANFDFPELVLINPKCNHLDNEAILRGKHSALKILKNAKVKNFSYLKSFDYLIGTTAKIGTDYNIPRSPLSPEELAEKVKVNKKIGLIFGREGIGLRNKEVEMCDFIVTIPTSKNYETMNVSHAVAIVLYEIYKKKGSNRVTEKILFAGKREKEAFLKNVSKVLDRMEFSTKEKRQTQKTLWKRLLGKAMLTKRELNALFGFLKKIK